MLRGLYTSSLGMTTQMNRMDVVANNLANVNTTGYKKDTAVNTTFADVLAKRTHDIQDYGLASTARDVGGITYGPYVNEVYTDFAQGAFETTGNALDVALTGSGYFVVSKQDNGGNVQELLTRDGAFTVTAEGYLVTKDGGRVQGQSGDIMLENGIVTIEANGDILVNSEYVDTLRTKAFEDETTLRKTGDNYLMATGNSVEIACEASTLQGVLELSNVNTVEEMVEMIAINRAYEANQKAVQTIDSTLQRSVQEIGRKQ